MTRSLLPLALVFTIACAPSDDPETTGQTDDPIEDDGTRTFRFGFGRMDPNDPGPLEGVTVEVYDALDLDHPLDTAVTDEEGFAALSFVWPDGIWVAHAFGDDLHDAWFWYTRTLPDQSGTAWSSLPIPNEQEWADIHDRAGVTPDPERGVVAMEAVDPTTDDLMADATGMVEPSGVVVYDTERDGIDATLQSGASTVFAFDVPAGDATLTVTNDTATMTRDFVVFPDSISYSIEQANAL